MRFDTLSDWLTWQETLHPNEIELGLVRVQAVLAKMGLNNPDFTVVSVAGTNGKGSSVAMLSAVYCAADYCVGAYMSPHLNRYNERIRIQGIDVCDAALCAAFERVEQCRGEIPLTYFEFGTLAAIDIFAQAKIDIAIMEVGLGGRLDAVNCLNADVALITAISMDHVEWLGDNRDRIAIEKAGIARPGRPTVCSDINVPQTLITALSEIQSTLYLINRDYHYELVAQPEFQPNKWCWWSQHHGRNTLDLPAMLGDYQLQNAAGVVMVLALMQTRFPVTRVDIQQGLSNAVLPGRFQIKYIDVHLQSEEATEKQILHIVDVAHNPGSALVLAETANDFVCQGKTHAVFAILQDKDIAGVVAATRYMVDIWHIADLIVPRGAKATDIANILKQQGVTQAIHCYPSTKQALEAAQGMAITQDRIVIFGSFHTVSEIL
ncbi:MAG: bifunctional tetrahydrofolate synthase/dihydrofolate synthase [Gammaproteobacteria bacterium]|nr:bifunctional tetrahydrofolate synthase/dihydrofolate synthase [Gammaproteobacteria bacterium]